MSISLAIKYVQPFKEVFPEINGKKSTIAFGVKVYNSKELPEIREKFFALVANEELEQVVAQLERLDIEGDKTTSEFYLQRKELRDRRDTINKEQIAKSNAFYKEQVLFIRNATVEADEDGKKKDLVIADSRNASPVESLWSTPEECLAVLLDMFLSHPSIADSLTSEIANVVLNINTDAKAKNSK
jgi:hypothetical protein